MVVVTLRACVAARPALIFFPIEVHASMAFGSSFKPTFTPLRPAAATQLRSQRTPAAHGDGQSTSKLDATHT